MLKHMAEGKLYTIMPPSPTQNFHYPKQPTRFLRQRLSKKNNTNKKSNKNNNKQWNKPKNPEEGQVNNEWGSRRDGERRSFLHPNTSFMMALNAFPPYYTVAALWTWLTELRDCNILLHPISNLTTWKMDYYTTHVNVCTKTNWQKGVRKAE